MSTVIADAPSAAALKTRDSGLAAFVDRWIFVFMAALFIATALAGFLPASMRKLAMIEAGVRAPFPAVLHVHAVLMGTWLLLLLVQTTLMATGRSAMHRQLGLASLLLAPAILVTGFILVPTMLGQAWPVLQSPPPGMPPAEAQTTLKFLSSLVAAQIEAGLLFAIFITWALLTRKSDPGMHKRLMILATAVPLPAAIDRIELLPTTYPESTLSPHLYVVLWIMPMLVWDLIRHRRLHRAYVVWLAFFVPSSILVINLWWSPWWIALAPRLIGVAD